MIKHLSYGSSNFLSKYNLILSNSPLDLNIEIHLQRYKNYVNHKLTMDNETNI